MNVPQTRNLFFRKFAGDQERLYCVPFVTSGQVYAPGPYGDYVTPPPHAQQIIYTADGQPYPGAYPYHYQGEVDTLCVCARCLCTLLI